MRTAYGLGFSGLCAITTRQEIQLKNYFMQQLHVPKERATASGHLRLTSRLSAVLFDGVPPFLCYFQTKIVAIRVVAIRLAAGEPFRFWLFLPNRKSSERTERIKERRTNLRILNFAIFHERARLICVLSKELPAARVHLFGNSYFSKFSIRIDRNL